MELQLPFVRKILAENFNVHYHIWNLTRDPSDNNYLQKIKGDRITVINEFHHARPWTRFNDVYRYYTDENFKKYTFVKIDDDVVFLETDRFKQFVQTIRERPNEIISANVVNNGACTSMFDGLSKKVERIGVPILDVHRSNTYARMCHEYFYKNWPDIVDQDVDLVSTEDWLSINVIGYNWDMNKEIASRVGGPSPAFVAGRHFRPRDTLGDEGMVNTLPRTVMKGFTAGHLTFGPQNVTAQQALVYRQYYKEINDDYHA